MTHVNSLRSQSWQRVLIVSIPCLVPVLEFRDFGRMGLVLVGRVPGVYETVHLERSGRVVRCGGFGCAGCQLMQQRETYKSRDLGMGFIEKTRDFW